MRALPSSPASVLARLRDDSVHASLYLDPEVFERELEQIFHKGWVYVAHESEVPEAGSFRLSTIARRSEWCACTPMN